MRPAEIRPSVVQIELTDSASSAIRLVRMRISLFSPSRLRVRNFGDATRRDNSPGGHRMDRGVRAIRGGFSRLRPAISSISTRPAGGVPASASKGSDFPIYAENRRRALSSSTAPTSISNFDMCRKRGRIPKLSAIWSVRPKLFRPWRIFR